MEATLELQLLTSADWRMLRVARLEALLDSPQAFTSNYAHESAWSEPDWRRAFDGSTWIIAREAENVIGLARSVGEGGGPATRHLESIWVAPNHRRRGVLRALLQAIAEIELKMGVADLLLWVLEDNPDAQHAYEALGFEATGERQFLRAVGRFERRLRLALRYVVDSYAEDVLFESRPPQRRTQL